MKLFCERLKQSRIDLNMSQQSLADILQIDQSKISKWERGKNEPNLEMLHKIAKALDVSSDYLIGLSEI